MTIFGTLDSGFMQAVSVPRAAMLCKQLVFFNYNSSNTIIAFIPPIAFEMFGESLGDELPLLAH